MTIIFLIAQGLLSLFFLLGGLRYLLLSVATLTKNESSKFLLDVPEPLIRFIGVAKIVGSLAIIVSTLTGLAPWSVPLAALGIALLMLCAGMFHLSRGEFSKLPLNGILLLLALLVVVGRWSWVVA
jgi:putative oxidoreductase